MSAKNKKQFGVWMDSHNATVVGRADVDAGDFVVLGHVKNDGADSNSSEKTSNNAEKTLMQKFFKEITSHMQNAEEVHLTGTGTAQEQLIHHMSETPQFKSAVVKESTSNKMSDEKLIEFISGRFN